MNASEFNRSGRTRVYEMRYTSNIDGVRRTVRVARLSGVGWCAVEDRHINPQHSILASIDDQDACARYIASLLTPGGPQLNGYDVDVRESE